MKNKYLSNVSFQKVKGTSLTILFTLFAFTVHAQVGIGTITPDPSAQLEIQSADKGLLIPRVTESTRTTVMLTPATGLLVYQTDGVAPGFYYFDGSAWQPLKTPAAPSGSTIIPYSNGPLDIQMTTKNGVGNDLVAAIGFGNWNLATLTPSGIPAAVSNMAFSVPRAGSVASISARFSSISNAQLAGTLYVKAKLYLAEVGSSYFVPLSGAEVLFSFDGAITSSDIRQGTVSGLNIPVAAGDRLLLAFACTETYDLKGISVYGYVNAGVEIK